MVPNFIVLGLIPGTHIQINFTDWLIVASLLVLFIALWPLIRIFIYRLVVLHRLFFTILALLTIDRRLV
jgi:hypothetical protein